MRFVFTTGGVELPFVQNPELAILEPIRLVVVGDCVERIIRVVCGQIGTIDTVKMRTYRTDRRLTTVATMIVFFGLFRTIVFNRMVGGIDAVTICRIEILISGVLRDLPDGCWGFHFQLCTTPNVSAGKIVMAV